MTDRPSEDQIERRRWYAKRILSATPSQPDFDRFAAMRYLKASRDPWSYPDYKITKDFEHAFKMYWRYYNPSGELNLIEDNE